MSNHLLSRRAVLHATPLGLASLAMLSPAAMASSANIDALAPASSDQHNETPELVAALESLAASCQLAAKLADDLDWLEAEWQHRWPAAPEEILSHASCMVRQAVARGRARAASE